MGVEQQLHDRRQILPDPEIEPGKFALATRLLVEADRFRTVVMDKIDPEDWREPLPDSRWYVGALPAHMCWVADSYPNRVRIVRLGMWTPRFSPSLEQLGDRINEQYTLWRAGAYTYETRGSLVTGFDRATKHILRELASVREEHLDRPASLFGLKISVRGVMDMFFEHQDLHIGHIALAIHKRPTA